jgi:hypothetical protein
MLFSDERKHKLSIPTKDDQGNAVNIGWLVKYLCEKVMKDSRKEMFVLDGHVYVAILYLPIHCPLLALAKNWCCQINPSYAPIIHPSSFIPCSLIALATSYSPSLSPTPFPVHLQSSPDTNPYMTSALTDNVYLHCSRPGILVLINDADWELEGEASYALQPNDNILFVSTLHGG